MHTTQLPTAELGRTGLQITRVGLGAWAIGGGGWEFEAIDLYQIHWPNPPEEIEGAGRRSPKLKEQELVRHIGVLTAEDVDQIEGRP